MPKSPLDRLSWFNALVTPAVILILIVAGGGAVMSGSFDPMALAGAIFLLLMLPVLVKLVSRRLRR